MAKRARPTRRRSKALHSKSAVAERSGRSGVAPVPAPVIFSQLPGPPAEAVAVFEEAMAALQRHEYSSAARHFQTVLTRFSGERALTDRSRVYLSLCERELASRPAGPETVEERLTAATAALNNDDVDEAETLVRAVLEEAPSHDLGLYLLAAVEARRGARESALTLLTRAFDVSPEIRAQVRHDLDFETLRDLEEFQQLLDAPIVRESQALVANQRRGRRVRAER